MLTLLVHNYYQRAGGEDAVFAAEKHLLHRAGHRVVEYVRQNEEVSVARLASQARLALGTVWASDSYAALFKLIRRERPEIAHFHNTFPLISPAAYYACRDGNVPVVQTLHNYRLLCPAATFFRDGVVCEDCLGRLPWPGVGHGCYRDSRRATLAAAAMLSFHRWRKTWTTHVDRYIALTQFARQKFIEGGFPPERISVKPNFLIADPGPRLGQGKYALFLGRLSSEKGLSTLLRAWHRLATKMSLRIVGDGPLRAALEAEVADKGISGVRFLGHLPHDEVVSTLKRARFVVLPSEWYEAFPMTIVEAFACAVPVIATRLGASAEVVDDHRTGLHFTPGDPDDLAAKVEWAWSHPSEMDKMGHAARAEYEARYTAERNYALLMDVYNQALGSLR